jgi:NTP pyrophosphatase (non-canonical NTP hydrolase)
MDTFSKIRQWAEDRNLIKGSTSASQMLKLVEELGELAGSINKNRREDIADGIGDAVVVLTIIAAMHGLEIERCVEDAYRVIKDRKGQMIGGVFVKEEDLKKARCNDVIHYRGVSGTKEYDYRDNVWFGQLLVDWELYTYEGSTEEELQSAFVAAVEDYFFNTKE